MGCAALAEYGVACRRRSFRLDPSATPADVIGCSDTYCRIRFSSSFTALGSTCYRKIKRRRCSIYCPDVSSSKEDQHNFTRIQQRNQTVYHHIHFHENREDMFKDAEKSTVFETDVTSLSSPTEGPPPYSGPSDDGATLLADFKSPMPDLMLHPGKLLTLHARGSGIWHCASSEYSIPIYAGTDISAAPLYVSNKIKRGSNSAILSHKTEGEIISTTYRMGWGKNRQPKIRYIQNQTSYGNDIKTEDASDVEGPVALQAATSCWTNTTTMTSEINPNQVLVWKYLRTRTTTEGKVRVMALFDESASSSSSKAESNEAIAVLLRTSSTRTPGTKKCDAGNGGQLFINSTNTVDDALIVASCLMYLKKEIDRAKSAQAAAISAAASS